VEELLGLIGMSVARATVGLMRFDLELDGGAVGGEKVAVVSVLHLSRSPLDARDREHARWAFVALGDTAAKAPGRMVGVEKPRRSGAAAAPPVHTDAHHCHSEQKRNDKDDERLDKRSKRLVRLVSTGAATMSGDGERRTPVLLLLTGFGVQ